MFSRLICYDPRDLLVKYDPMSGNCLGLSCSTQISHAQHITIKATCFAKTLNLEATAPTQNQQHGIFSSEAKEDDEEKVEGESEKARISFRILTTFEDM